MLSEWRQRCVNCWNIQCFTTVWICSVCRLHGAVPPTLWAACPREEELGSCWLCQCVWGEVVKAPSRRAGGSSSSLACLQDAMALRFLADNFIRNVVSSHHLKTWWNQELAPEVEISNYVPSKKKLVLYYTLLAFYITFICLLSVD